MGNSIPHGDRLHECSATCPEYKNGPMPGTVLNYQHDDGRHCIIGPDGIWRHWDHPVPEPGPREVVDYKCLRSHPEPAEMMVDLSSDPPSPLRSAHGTATWGDGSAKLDEDMDEESKDRGDFGMPGLGVYMRDVDTSPFSRLALGRGGPMDPVSHRRVLDGIADSIGMKVDGDRLVNKYDWPKTTINVEGVWYDYGEQGNRIEPATQQARRILGKHLPEVMEHFLQRNAEYGEEAHVLGVKGQFADINRKVIKLKRYLWDDVEVMPGAENIETIAGELIGHLLILIDEMDKEDNGHGKA